MSSRRNKPCYCGSGKKFKKCCMPRLYKEKYENFVSEITQKEIDKEAIYYSKKYKKIKNEEIKRNKTA